MRPRARCRRTRGSDRAPAGREPDRFQRMNRAGTDGGKASAVRKIGSRYFKRCDGANDRRDGAVDGAVYGRGLIRCASKLSCKKNVERHLARWLMHFLPEIRT